MSQADKKNKICICLPSLEYGGAERRMILLALGLQAKGYDVEVLVLRLLISQNASQNKGDFSTLLTDAGIAIQSVNKGGKWDLIAAAFRMTKVFKKQQYDLVLSCLPSANLFASLIKCVNRKTPLIWGIAASDMPLHEYGYWAVLGDKLQKLLSRSANKIIVNSYKAKTVASKSGFSHDDLQVVQNGVDVEKFRPDESLGMAWRKEKHIPLESKVVGIVARLDPVKGFENFLAATDKADSKGWCFVVFCSGDSEYAQKIKQQIKSHPFYEKRIWMFENNIVDSAVYNALNVSTITSVSESFPNVMLEAMACGVPVVSTDVGDCSLVLKDLGEIVPVNNSQELCDAWGRVLNNEQAKQKSQMIREFTVKEFSIESMVDKFDLLISKMLQASLSKSVDIQK